MNESEIVSDGIWTGISLSFFPPFHFRDPVQRLVGSPVFVHRSAYYLFNFLQSFNSIIFSVIVLLSCTFLCSYI